MTPLEVIADEAALVGETLNGRDAKLLLVGYCLDHARVRVGDEAHVRWVVRMLLEPRPAT